MQAKTLPSVCPMDCPDTCSLEVEVADNQITQIHGSNKNPLTQGFICSKVSRFARRVYAPERLHFPMKRVGAKGMSKFERISWQEAAETICENFKRIKKEWGGEAILPYSYGGSNGLLGQDTSDRAFFAKLGASRLARTVCAAPTTEAAMGMYGKMPGTAFEDYEFANFILIWGANPKASNIHLVPYLKKAKAKGAKIVVVDPRLNFSNKEIDLHLPVYPGTDLVVALALINIWKQKKQLNWDFINRHSKGIDILLNAAEKYPVEKAAQIARIEQKEIEILADWYVEHDPAVLRVGWGLERNRNGGQAVAAVLSLPAVLGKFGVRGGGYTLSNSAAYKIDSHGLVDSPPWNTRIINMNKLGQVLLNEQNPPIKGLIVYNCNPVVTVPNQLAIFRGLERDDLFTVVFDQVITDTASFADILLPAMTFLEQQEIKSSYGAFALQYMEPVIEPIAEAKANVEVFSLLGRTMGWKEKAFFESTDYYLKRIVKLISGMGREINLTTLQKEKITFFDFPGTNPVQFKTVFPWTPDKKVNLAPGNLGERPFDYFPEKKTEYPLALISPSTDKMTSSTFGEFNFKELYLVMHPDDAQKRCINKGDVVKVYNDLSAVWANVKISQSVRPGVVFMPKGAWCKSSRNGLTSTSLIADTISAVGGGACFNDSRVEVELI